jgi:hypothetical protein
MLTSFRDNSAARDGGRYNFRKIKIKRKRKRVAERTGIEPAPALANRRRF